MADSILMEWLAQTKKLTKSIDYLSMAAIDSIVEVLDWVDRKTIINNDDFFDPICKKYHKPNPIDLIKKRKRAKAPCEMVSKLCQDTIDRCRSIQNDIQFQWFEIIDFFYEKPHLVNPHLIDEYTTLKINEICKQHKKNNPLRSDIKKRFGRYYRNERGEWKKERRKL